MALVTGRLTEGKPIVAITLTDASPAPARLMPQDRPASFNIREYRALLDTGADLTCVCDHVVADRRLRPHGFVRMVGAVGPSLHQTYIVAIGVPYGDEAAARGLYQLEPLEAASIRDNRWFDVLIGTDVLSQHEFTLTKGGGFRLILG